MVKKYAGLSQMVRGDTTLPLRLLDTLASAVVRGRGGEPL